MYNYHVLSTEEIEKLNDNYFYLVKKTNDITREDKELILRYMINLGIDIFLFQINDKKNYNIVTPDSYYKNKNIIAVSFQNIPPLPSHSSNLEGIYTKNGLKKIHNSKLRQQFGETMFLTWL